LALDAENASDFGFVWPKAIIWDLTGSPRRGYFLLPTGRRKKPLDWGLTWAALVGLITGYFMIAAVLPANADIGIHHFARISVAKFGPALSTEIVGIGDLSIDKDKTHPVGLGVVGHFDRINIDPGRSPINHFSARMQGGRRFIEIANLKISLAAAQIVVRNNEHADIFGWYSAKISDRNVTNEQIRSYKSPYTTRLYANIGPQFTFSSVFSVPQSTISYSPKFLRGEPQADSRNSQNQSEESGYGRTILFKKISRASLSPSERSNDLGNTFFRLVVGAFVIGLCSETAKLDRFWLEFSAVIPWLGGAESDEGIEVFGRPEGVHSQAGR